LAAPGTASGPLVDGYEEIARRLFVSRQTVKSHLAHGYAKLGARNRADAVARALQSSLIDVVGGEELPSGPTAEGATPNDRYAPPAVRSRIRANSRMRGA
jgi:Bacterial regulatory proteins, luxR family